MDTLDPQLTFINNKQEGSGGITERKHVPAARKNKFHQPVTQRGHNYESIKEIIDKYVDPTQNEEQQIQNMEASLVGDNSPTKKTHSTSLTHKIQYKSFEKSISTITSCFLQKVDNYFDQMDTMDIPSSKIQLYTTTISQPSIYSNAAQYKSRHNETTHSYDFQFEQQKKKRPKTPYKRKKLYEQS